MKFNVVYNKHINGYESALSVVEAAIQKKEVEYRTFELESMEYFGEFTFVIGGDGTLLRAARYYAEWQIPVLGVNMGRLGFLSQSGVEGISEVIDEIICGKYSVEDRLMLSSLDYIALNDFVIKGCNHSRTSKFYLEINGKYVCDYIADGLIISTPTGSTAYGLSAGGPVVYPTIDALTIVPICPHTLNARPLVVPAGEKIVVKTADKLLTVYVDGYDSTQCVDKIEIQSALNKAKLAFLNKTEFYTVLRDKLSWGVSPSN